MEGKGNLFKQFADLDVFDLEVGSENAEDVIRFCQLLEPTVGGINLEDIRAPDCFLHRGDAARRRCGSPCSTTTSTARRSSPARRCSMRWRSSGRPSASVKRRVLRRGRRRDRHRRRITCASACSTSNIIICDRAGVIYDGRDGAHGPLQGAVRQHARQRAHARRRARRRRRVRGTLGRGRGHRGDDRADGARPDRLRARQPRAGDPARTKCRRVRPDAIIATGRSDYPNQVNNVLGFPFIFRGALDARATEVNEEMKMAATRALAMLAREDVPESVAALYGLQAGEVRARVPHPLPLRSARAALGGARRGVGRGRERRGRASSSTSRRIASTSRRGSGARAASCAGSSTAPSSDPKRVVLPEGEERKIHPGRAESSSTTASRIRSCWAHRDVIRTTRRAARTSRSRTSRSRIRAVGRGARCTPSCSGSAASARA